MNALARLLRILTTPSTCDCCKDCKLGQDCSCDTCDVAYLD